MKYQFEVTDTFGGEANYSWVKRTIVDIPDGIGDVMLRMLAKRWAGFDGVRCEIENLGDQQILRPRGLCQVLFVTYTEPEDRKAEALRSLLQWVEATGVENNPALAGCDKRALENARKVAAE